MRVNSTVALTLILLSLMIGGGVVSASWGYALGREALKGITQPDVRPNSRGTSSTGSAPPGEGLVLLQEEDILTNVKARIQGDRGNSPATPENAPSPADAAANPATTNAATEVVSTATSLQPGFPIVSRDRGVSLEIRSAQSQGGALVLEVNLQNNGSRPARFLYSFMNITDNRGRTFSANTEGLPGELPSDGDAFTGTVSIPLALLDGSETLSLALTDYPDQQLQLQVSGIPVVR